MMHAIGEALLILGGALIATGLFGIWYDRRN
jgi:hypothetical protein